MPARPDAIPRPSATSGLRPVRRDFSVFDGGDDMVRARGFCDTARAEMDRIIAAERDAASDPGRDPHWLCERLTAVQQGAKRARARSVYRSAQDVMDQIHCNGPHMPIDWSQVDGHLLVLNKLLIQYTQGVEEVEVACEVAQAPVPARPANDEDAFVQARRTLSELLPHASEDERAALQRLLDAGETRSDPVAPSVPLFALEDALPELVQRLLGHGREFGKSLSVSYALDGVALPEGERDALVQTVWERLTPLIASDMPLQGIGHLDIVADGQSLRVTGSGFGALDIPMDQMQQPSTSASAEARPVPKPQTLRPQALQPKAHQPLAHQPMITPDTEADLRAQLAALLDGSNPPKPTPKSTPQ